MTVKIVVRYEVTYNDVEKLVKNNEWNRIDIHTKTSLHSFPKCEIESLTIEE